MKTVGERIRQARNELKMSGDELAKKSGYQRQSGISNLENRTSGTGGNKINAIADALGVSVEWLLRGPDGDKVPFLNHQSYPHNHAVNVHTAQQDNQNPVQSLTTSHSFDATHDEWTSAAISIMMSLPDNDKRAAVANLRTFVHNLSPPTEQVVPANNERNGTYR